MRKNQLSIHIESFSDQAIDNHSHEIEAYIDGNSIYEVLKEQLNIMYSIYGSNDTFEEFVEKIRNYDTDESRFGRTNFKVRTHDDKISKTVELIDGSPE